MYKVHKQNDAVVGLAGFTKSTISEERGMFAHQAPMNRGNGMALYEMTDDEWFAEIEEEQRKSRRREEQRNSVSKFLGKLSSAVRDVRDGFSLPQGVSIKYAP